MNLLIDTHILIWYIAGNPSLKPAMTDLLEATENNLLISVASLWEIAIKVSKGKLDLRIDFYELEGILDRLNIQNRNGYCGLDSYVTNSPRRQRKPLGFGTQSVGLSLRFALTERLRQRLRLPQIASET